MLHMQRLPPINNSCKQDCVLMLLLCPDGVLEEPMPEAADAVPMASPTDESHLASLKKKLAGRHSTTKEC